MKYFKMSEENVVIVFNKFRFKLNFYDFWYIQSSIMSCGCCLGTKQPKLSGRKRIIPIFRFFRRIELYSYRKLEQRRSFALILSALPNKYISYWQN